MRWIALALLAAGCTDPVGLGAASASAYPTATSATVIVVNATDGVIDFRVWSIEIGEDEPGTDCRNRGNPLAILDVFTQLPSAPRGEIISTTEEPPPVFPGVFVHYSNGTALDGLLTIDTAASTGLVGSFSGSATLDGSVVQVDIDFDAPTCGV